MKKIKFAIIAILLLLVNNVNALETNIDKVTDNYDKYTYIEVTSLNNIDKINNLINLKEILIKNVSIEDISFINNLNNLTKISIYYSKLNLSNLNNINITEIDIISSYVINNDLSSLNNTSITKLDLEGTYIKDVSTISNIKTIRELNLSSISNLNSLEPILSLPNLKKLDFGGSEDLITEDVFNYIRNKNIIGSNYRETEYMYLHGSEYSNKLDEIITNLNLANLSTLDKIKEITLYVTDFIEYDDDCENNNCSYKEISFNRVAKSLSGKGVCYHYALLLNKLLNKIGIDSYLVSGFTTKGIGHEWVNIYLDDTWYAIDPTWIDFNNRSTKLKNTGKTDYYMIKLTDNCNYYKDHIADVLPSKIVDTDVKIIEKPIEVENDDNTNTTLMMILVVISILIIIIISTYFLIEKLKNNYNKR